MKQLFLQSVFILSALLLSAQVNTAFKFNGEQSVFTENKGQVVDQNGQAVPGVLAKASMPGLDMYLTQTGVTYILLQYNEDLTAKPHPVFITDKKFKVTYSRVDVALTGATIGNNQMQFTGQAGWQSNYYRTEDGKGQLALSHFSNMTVQNVYPGVDWVWKFNASGNLEYEFVVHPGADPAVIKMHYSYADLTAAKNKLTIGTRIGSLTEGPLLATCGAGKVTVAYNVDVANKDVTFAAGSYDKTKDMVIDPPLGLNWSAQFGGSFLNGLRGVTTDVTGGVYLVGYTTSSDFPTRTGGAGSYIDSTYNGQSDAIVLKLDTLQNLKWATYIGGPGNDFANSVSFAAGTTQDIYITGGAASGYPVVNGVANHGGQDAFVSVFQTTNLALKYSGFFGGNGTDEGLRIHCDQTSVENFYLAGYTNSINTFATLQPGSSFLQTAVTGQEAFIMKLEFINYYNTVYPLWSTKYGGSGDDYATGISVDSLGNMILSGYTTSTNIPLVNAGNGAYYQGTNGGGNDGFILKFNNNDQLTSASYYGGQGDDYITDVTVGPLGSYEFSGRTNSTNFPIDSIAGFSYNQTHLADASGDAFIIKLENNLKRQWATYYGGSALDAGTGIAADNAGNIYLSGFTFSTNFPVQNQNGAYYQPTNHGNADGFIAQFTELGIRKWSTYKGDSCYQYPNDIAYDNVYKKFYVAGEGLLNCIGDTAGQSLPDTGQVNANGTSSIGFCWGFSGATTPPCGALQLSLSNVQQPCPGQCNGIAQITVSDTVPYHIIWSNGSTAYLDSNLCTDGWVEIKDTIGCTREQDVQFNPLSVNLSTVAIVCYPFPGSESAIVSGGNPNYLYQWSTSPGYGNAFYIQPTDTGVYSVTVEDSRQCTATATAELGFNNVGPDAQLEVILYPNCITPNGIFTLDNFNTDPNFPNGNVVWEDFNFNVFATGDTFYNAGSSTLFYAVDSAFCYNGVNAPVYYGFDLNDEVSLLQVSSYNNPSTCISNDGNAYATFSFTQQYSTYQVTNPGYWNNYITVDSFSTISYYWSDGETSAYASMLGIGPFSVTAQDGNCINQINAGDLELPLPQISATVDSDYCANGSIDVSGTYDPNGGPWTYLFSDGGTSQSDQGLATGYYQVTVTDGLNCSASASEYVPLGTPVQVNVSSSDALCNDGNGTLTVSGEYGVPPYFVTGFGNGTSLNAPYYSTTGQYPAGDYFIYITDNQGCAASNFVTIGQPSQLVINVDSIAPAICNSGTETVNVIASGGTAPYSGTGIQYEPVGTNVITVTDANGCTASNTITVNTSASSNPIIISSSYSPILCTGGSTTVTVSATGGSGTYTGTGIFNESAGTYYFVVSDGNGCSAVDTEVIADPTPLTITITDSGIGCQHPDTVNANVLGGTGPYQYQWSYVFSTSASIYVTAPGYYRVTVTDANGCIAADTDYVDFIVPVFPSYGFTILKYPSCGLNNGVIVFANPYPGNVTWKTFYGQTLGYGDTIRNVADTSAYIVYDAAYCENGQPYSMTYSLELLSPFNSATTFFGNQPTGCNTQDGALLASPYYTLVSLASSDINGAQPLSIQINNYPTYTYQWSNGVTITEDSFMNQGNNYILVNNPSLHNLNAGTYTLTITDGTCQQSFNYTLTDNSPMVVANYQVTEPGCAAAGNGRIQLNSLANNSNNGLAYTDTFAWSNGASTQSVSNLSAGTYMVTITGPNACPVIDTFNIIAPVSNLAVTDMVSPVACYNGNATVTISATGGVMPYTGTGTFSKPAGSYVLTVTDASGCPVNDSVVVAPSLATSALVATNVLTPVLCYGGSDTVTISASGGISPYTGTGSFTESGGTHYFTLTDANGCSVVDTVVFIQPAQINVSVTSLGITCTPGAVNANVTGGIGPYQFEWNTSPGFGDSDMIYVRDTGTYTVVVKDSAGCMDTAYADVRYNNLPVQYYDFVVQQYPSCGLNNGLIYFTSPNGNKITWIWPWPNTTISYGDTLFAAQTNDYSYIVIDSSYCTNGVVTPVQYQLDILSAVSSEVSPFIIYPVNSGLAYSSNGPTGCNTQDGGITTYCDNTPYVRVYVNGQWGNASSVAVVNYSPITYQWSNGDYYTLDTNYYGEYYNNSQFGFLNEGNYYLTVTDGTCETVTSIALTVNNPPLVANYSLTEPTCNGDSNGAIRLLSLMDNLNGTFGYLHNTFLWSTGDTSESISNLPPNIYTVTITGPNACPVVDTFNIVSAVNSLVISNTITTIPCFNGNATVTIAASGGTLPYTGTGLYTEPAGNYVLTVTDASGCSANDSIVVAPSLATSALVEHETVIPVPCHGETATVTISASGGVAPFTGTGTYHKPAGTYVMMVTDSLGCSASDTLQITQPGVLYVTNVVNPVLCHGGDATINLTCAGGTTPYTGTGTFSRPAGNYVFDISDANGCLATDTIIITQPTPLVVTDTVTTNALCYGGTGIVHVVATGGTAPYYGSGVVAEPAGNNLLVITDNNGCADSVSATISQPTPVNVSIQWLDTVALCRDTVKAVISVTGGNGPYTGTGTVVYTHNGNYTITVSDANGCTVDSTLSIHLDTCVGINQVAEDLGVSVYPNPAADMFYVKFTTQLNDAADLRLYGVDGKLIMLKTAGAGTDLSEMDCSHLASGVYVLRTVVQGKEYNFKVVVTR